MDAASPPSGGGLMEGKILTQTLRFPIWILRSEAFIALRRQSPLALRVLLCIWAHGQGYGTRCFPGEKRLAALCKTSVPSVSQAIKLLELAGWLGVLRQRELGRGNIYTLRAPESLGPLAGRIQAWLDAPSSGSDPAPQEAFVLQAGDLWGQAGKGRRRCRVAWISLASMNSDLWDLLWRTDALAGHLWLLLQACGPSGEQVSLSRLARELGVKASAISAALARLRAEGLISSSVRGSQGTVHTVVPPAPEDRLAGAGAVPQRGRTRRPLRRTAKGRWVHREESRPRRALSAPKGRLPRMAPRKEGGRSPPPPPPTSAFPPRWCREHGAIADFLSSNLRYGGTLSCGCNWAPGYHDQLADPRRPADYRAL